MEDPRDFWLEFDDLTLMWIGWQCLNEPVHQISATYDKIKDAKNLAVLNVILGVVEDPEDSLLEFDDMAVIWIGW